jgi:hypothetical protein
MYSVSRLRNAATARSVREHEDQTPKLPTAGQGVSRAGAGARMHPSSHPSFAIARTYPILTVARRGQALPTEVSGRGTPFPLVCLDLEEPRAPVAWKHVSRES